MNRDSHRTLSLVALVAIALLATLAPDPAAAQVVYGPSVALGEGTARTYLVVGDDGAPLELGVEIDEAAMSTLPENADVPMEEAVVARDLALPEGTPAPYVFAGLDWNPKGHPPEGVYDRPHFDFHFFMIDEAERAAIDPSDPDWDAKATRPLPEEQTPPGYVLPPDTAVPQMGSHWVDPASPEFNGETFTRTVLYGSWDGRMIFVEPMITRAYLEAATDETHPIAVPASVAEPGWYPSAYRVTHDAEANAYRVSIVDFTEKG